MSGRDDHAAAVAVCCQQQAEPRDCRGVKAERRLVQEPERRRGKREAGKREAPLLPGGKHPRRKIGEIRQAEGGQGGDNLIGVLRSLQTTEKRQILPYGQPGLHGVRMSDIRHPLRMPGQIGQRVPPVPQQPPCRRPPQSRQQSQQRGFPGTIRAREHQRAAGRNGEVQVAENQTLPAERRQTLCRQHA